MREPSREEGKAADSLQPRFFPFGGSAGVAAKPARQAMGASETVASPTIRSRDWHRIQRMNTESVWDYPRPPAVEATSRRIRIVLNGVTIVDTTEAIRVLETSHPPVYYIPPSVVRGAEIRHDARRTFCEFKGVAGYVDVIVGDVIVEAGAWVYANPTRSYESIKDYLAFYPSKMDECWVGDYLVVPQHSDFYGGWITPDIEGPFKGS